MACRYDKMGQRRKIESFVNLLGCVPFNINRKAYKIYIHKKDNINNNDKKLDKIAFLAHSALTSAIAENLEMWLFSQNYINSKSGFMN